MIEQYIDHTLLKQTAINDEIIKLCEEAHANNFAAVCVPPYYVSRAKLFTAFTDKCKFKICTVIGFPLGYNSINAKMQEITDALYAGANEIDIVQNISAVKNKDWKFINKEISGCLDVIRTLQVTFPIVVKIILETGVLTDKEIIKCCQIYNKYDRIDFIKTSTGYADVGATIHHIKLIKENISPKIKIKASGGIRTYTFAKQLIDAGATRLGCSSGIKIIKEYKDSLKIKGSEVIHTTIEGIKTKGIIVNIHHNEYPDDNRTVCVFQPEDGPSLQVYLDELSTEITEEQSNLY